MRKLDVYQNQVGIINIEDYDYLRIAIIGLGSIGSFLAVALNKLGFKNLMIIDDDIIEHHNITTQLYFQKDIGKSKADTLKRCYLKGNINAYQQKVTSLNKLEADIVFVCVDTLKQRKLISKAILESYNEFKVPKLIIDGRMHRLVFRIFTISLENQQLLNNYVKGTMGKEFVGACTEKGIIQNIFVIVAMMVEQLKKVIKGEDYYAVINCDFERLTFVNSDLQEGLKKEEEDTEEQDI